MSKELYIIGFLSLGALFLLRRYSDKAMQFLQVVLMAGGITAGFYHAFAYTQEWVISPQLAKVLVEDVHAEAQGVTKAYCREIMED